MQEFIEEIEYTHDETDIAKEYIMLCELMELCYKHILKELEGNQ